MRGILGRLLFWLARRRQRQPVAYTIRFRTQPLTQSGFDALEKALSVRRGVSQIWGRGLDRTPWEGGVVLSGGSDASEECLVTREWLKKRPEIADVTVAPPPNLDPAV